MKLKRVTFTLTEEQYEFLRKKAFDERTSISELIRRAVNQQYMKQAEKEVRQKKD